ncbi:hypothetical protein [Blastomonas sp. SL216]|uniref:hypothetical protein n=1 Tax=Blastomonas sp. SL216 TaxID=2995169 RepID=UPI002377A322|nr:hypothetical protein OU999_11360 [Blastomonas sp. SL216]
MRHPAIRFVLSHAGGTLPHLTARIAGGAQFDPEVKARIADPMKERRAVFQQTHDQLNLLPVPALLQPAKGKLGLIDYEKIFCVSPEAGQDVYAMRQIDRARGCMVVVRPDQYIGHVLPLTATDALAEYFAGFMLPAMA